MPRPTSPSKAHRSTKRSKLSPKLEKMVKTLENFADIVEGGDAILLLDGMSAAPQTPIGLRVCTHALSLTSPVFKALFASASSDAQQVNGDHTTQTIIPVPDEDGDAVYILCNILHLRNDKLPARLLPSLLYKVASLAHKYQCVIAAGRATLQWFDRLYAFNTAINTWEIIEAAYLLDEAMFFARFTSRWIFEQSLYQRQMPTPTSTETQKLALLLSDRHTQAQTTLRNDLDTLVDSCAFAFSRDYKHYIDYAAGMSPEPEETPTGQPPVNCRVDPDGAVEYLGALRDAEVWPPTSWEKPKASGGSGSTIGLLIDRLKHFREPEYDNADRCEFCEDVKIKFTEQLDTMKEEQEKRLWGLCLDCYKAGGVNVGECRFEHAKPQLD